MKRYLCVVAIAAATLVLLPGLASGAAPVREPLVFPDELTLSAGVFCDWEGVVTFPVTQEYVTTFFDGAGNVTRMMITGRLVVTVTNVETGEDVTLNISGPSVQIDDVLTYHGPSIVFPVEGSLDFVHGRVVVTVDSEGFQHPVTMYRTTTDICALLG